MVATSLTIPFWLELIATLTGAISGSLHAVKHEYDFFGVVSLACITGLAGGIIRDVLLQNYGIYAFQHWELIVLCIVAALPVFFFCRLIDRFDLPMDIIDTFSVALWAVLGAAKAYTAGYGVLPSAILGTITAVGGGCLRDLLLLRPPRIFISGNLYAVATFFGALVYLLGRHFLFDEFTCAIVGIIVTLALRFISVFFDIKTKPARDYSDKAEALGRAIVNKLHLPLKHKKDEENK